MNTLIHGILEQEKKESALDPLLIQFTTDGSLEASQSYTGKTFSITFEASCMAGVYWIEERTDTPSASCDFGIIYNSSSGGAQASTGACPYPGPCTDSDVQSFTIDNITNLGNVTKAVSGTCWFDLWDQEYKGTIRITNIAVTSGGGTAQIGTYNAWYEDCITEYRTSL